MQYGAVAMLQAGDYWNHEGVWFGMTPNGLLASFAKHDVTQHPDGTITVAPSIRCTQPSGGAWHGYLERGAWREC